jgi:hypothetical protein
MWILVTKKRAAIVHKRMDEHHARHDVVGPVDDLGKGQRPNADQGYDRVEDKHGPPHVKSVTFFHRA